MWFEDQELEEAPVKAQDKGKGTSGPGRGNAPAVVQRNSGASRFPALIEGIGLDEALRWAQGPEAEGEALQAAVARCTADLAAGRPAVANADAKAHAAAVRGAIASSTLDAAEGQRMLATLAAVQKLGTYMETADAAYKGGKHKLALDTGRHARDQLRRLVGTGALPKDVLKPVYTRLSALVAASAPKAAMDTPQMCQYLEGGAKDWAYCGMTAMRMVLKYEGLPVPTQDEVATLNLPGVENAFNGTEASGSGMQSTARALGLEGAHFRTKGTQQQIVDSLDAGRPVCVAGEGTEKGSFVGGGSHYGTKKERNASATDGDMFTHKDGGAFEEKWGGHYQVAVGYEAKKAAPDRTDQPLGKKGQVTHFIINDPATGARIKVARSDFEAFFGKDGTVYVMTYKAAQQPGTKEAP